MTLITSLFLCFAEKKILNVLLCSCLLWLDHDRAITLKSLTDPACCGNKHGTHRFKYLHLLHTGVSLVTWDCCTRIQRFMESPGGFLNRLIEHRETSSFTKIFFLDRPQFVVPFVKFQHRTLKKRFDTVEQPLVDLRPQINKQINL